MTLMAKNVIAAGADNRSLMLEKSMYKSWQSRMKLYIRGKEHDKDLLDSVLNGPFQYGTIKENDITRPRTYEELADKENTCEKYDIRATNIVLQGLSPDVYNLINDHTIAKEIWDRLINDMNTIRMTMQKLQVNTKFANNLQPEWSKFVTDVKLAKDMHELNFNQLYAYLKKHEAHANEVHLMHERFLDPLPLVTNYHHLPSCYNNHQPQYNPSQYQQ
uniref:Integrase, catalytic region, zinc finger, CCHC-type, peptidase aspartic, catalytic n=1 Tax=Tanacetum cinerariifolium TaxID=118510 RepID=A0A699GKT5_TANCI|nr:hypothetical protein [Tanacetum cinerariifolium]